MDPVSIVNQQRDKHCRSRSQGEYCMMEGSLHNVNTTPFENRPIKIQRLQRSNTHIFEEEHKSSSFNNNNLVEDHLKNSSERVQQLEPLQSLMQLFHQQVTPYTYDTEIAFDSKEPAIDNFTLRCTELIQLLDPTLCQKDDCTTSTLEHLHGILFLWMSYLTNSHMPWDVINLDCYEVKKKLLHTTNGICTCLLELYRFLYRPNSAGFATIDSFMILFKTLLFLLKPIDSTKSVQYDDLIGFTSLLQVVDFTVHHVDIVNELTSYDFQEFLLCLLEISTTYMDDAVEPILEAVHQIARQIIVSLSHAIQKTDVLFTSFVQVAISVVSDPDPSLLLKSNTEATLLPEQLFRSRCVLQLSHNESVSEVIDFLEVLDRQFATRPSDISTCQKLVALDCVVKIASQHDQHVPKELREKLFGRVKDILIYFLLLPESVKASLLLKSKAVEGLQILTSSDDENDDTTFQCIMYEYRHDESALQQLASALCSICTQHPCDARLEHDTNSTTSSVNDTDSTFYDDAFDVWIFSDPILSAAEVFVELLSIIIEGQGDTEEVNNDSISPSLVSHLLNMCAKLLHYFSRSSASIRYYIRSQHVLYLIIHMLCRNMKSVGMYLPTNPIVLLAMANVLRMNDNSNDDNDLHVVTKLQYTILESYHYLLRTNRPLYQSLLGRNIVILQAITYIANDIDNNSFQIMDSVYDDDHDDSITATTNVSNQEMAIDLLCILSDDVFNRRIMAHQSNLLSGMIRYFRTVGTVQQEQGTTSVVVQRDTLKQRIAQLASVL
jgi:hypothetical protein